jgi:pimeloyl-ACP methyl ester carboxylesterase
MLNLVFLPATEPGDATYGTVPAWIEAYPAAAIHQIHYPAMVWYNKTVCREAIAQIRSIDAATVILVGFSKSGLGAWNIARSIPDRISGTIIFDAPVARDELPPWGTGPFYASDTSWQEDLPIRTIRDFQAVMPKTHSLVLLSGESFHEEMCALSQALSKIKAEHVFLPRPHLKHHWQSGWIEEGLHALLKSRLQGDI